MAPVGFFGTYGFLNLSIGDLLRLLLPDLFYDPYRLTSLLAELADTTRLLLVLTIGFGTTSGLATPYIYSRDFFDGVATGLCSFGLADAGFLTSSELFALGYFLTS
jgi:hypothetical protein